MTLKSIEEKQDYMNNLKDGLIDFVAGSLGGIALVYVGQPLDTVKVKMQTFPSIYKGMINCFVKTVKTDGIIRGLYAGTMPAVVANVAENSVLFTAYGGCQKVVSKILGKEKVEDLSSLGNACAGFFAAFFSSLTLCPTELIKCKLQAMHEVQSQMDIANKVMARIGPWELTRNILKEQVTRELLAKPNQKRDDIGWQKTMVAGAVGGTVLWLVIFPADVVKSRIQVQNLKTPALVVMKDIIKQEGIGALYNGLKPTLIRTIPATATLFITYEYTKKLIHRFVNN
ncbi:mitochondrial ornithine transporter 1 isoform X3 [Vespa velutina]|uniref:mitochondrial ornithine transporter 1 isoform X3 n=1 Tax=Vespa velutina TaxID=202808 RepID=UPI001FB4E3F3|nr:mitochondrial ornithine transporter 1 isoform X3 [Vespa velutina]